VSERCGRPWGCPCRHRHERRCTIGNCLVGANALITEGKEFPDNSLIVGTPAKAALRGIWSGSTSLCRIWAKQP
jgi:hypothetical protein